MTNKKLLIGSLSNDLMRVATFMQRGSGAAAERFFAESQRWVNDLSSIQVKGYIRKILIDLKNDTFEKSSLEKAEKYLMYGILLQNYSLNLR